VPVKRLIDRLLDFCYPGQCPSCGEGYDAAAMLCSDCEEEMERLVHSPACRRCAMPLVEDDAPCPYCRGKGLSPFDQIISLGLFREPLKGAIHRAKYSRRWPLAEELAVRLFEQAEVQTLLEKSDYLLPVPLHRRRQVERGYNQAEVLARRMGARCGKPIRSPVARVRDTETQTHLHSRAKRAENLRDAFVVTQPDAVRARHIVLVDDVMTTGATLASLARTLKIAQPATISAIVLAVADPRGRGFEVI
jgi:ComF family protein